MPKLEAIKEIRYGGKTVKPGETFDVLDKDVKILKAIKKAKEPEAAAAPPKTLKRPPAPKAAEPPKAPEPTQAWNTAGTYQRRDLKAED